MRQLSNNNLVANNKTRENLIKINVTYGWLVTQYNCLEFTDFASENTLIFWW